MTKKLLRMPEKLHDELKRFAKQEGYTLNGLIIKILWEWQKENLSNQ